MNIETPQEEAQREKYEAHRDEEKDKVIKKITDSISKKLEEKLEDLDLETIKRLGAIVSATKLYDKEDKFDKLYGIKVELQEEKTKPEEIERDMPECDVKENRLPDPQEDEDCLRERHYQESQGR